MIVSVETILAAVDIYAERSDEIYVCTIWKLMIYER
jgi:hypothetical protein